MLCKLFDHGPLADTQPDWSSLSKGWVTWPHNLSPLTLNYTTKAPLLLTPPIPIRPSCHKQIPGTTICPYCLCGRKQLSALLSSHIIIYSAYFLKIFLMTQALMTLMSFFFFLSVGSFIWLQYWLLILSHSPPFCPLVGMSHEPKSPSLGMISTATRTTATVSPLTPSPLNGSIVANGSPATQSAHSGFAAALRKLAKQAEEPRGKAAPPV